MLRVKVKLRAEGRSEKRVYRGGGGWKERTGVEEKKSGERDIFRE